MAKTLIVKGADFSANKLDNVDFGGVIFAEFDYHIGYYLKAGTDSASVEKYSTRTCFGKTGTGLHALWMDAETKEIGLTFMPYPIPRGRKKLKITTTANTYVIFTDNTTVSSAGNGSCKAISHDSDWVAGNREITVPDGANSFFISIGSKDPTALTVEFLLS